MKRSFLYILAALLLTGAFVSCTGSEEPETETIPAETTIASETAETESGRKAAKDSLPDDLDLGGMNIHIFSFSSEDYDIIGMGEESGETVFDAVYNRTRSVAERLNANITWEDSAHQKWQEFSAEMEQTIMAGDDAWQMVFAQGNSTIQSNRDHLFMDLANAKYLDLEKPWWWQEAMEEVSFDNISRRYLIGDIALTNFLRAGCVFFNKAIYTDAIGDPDDLYTMVIDGNWTIDAMTEVSAQAYQDLNGSGTVDEGDIYGYRFGGFDYVNYMEYATDVSHYYRDENGYPVIEYDLERAQLAAEKLYKLLYETKGNAFSKDHVKASDFVNRNTFFFGNQLLSAVGGDLRNMEDDYGIIPYPKLDENQEDYNNLLFNSSSCVVIPITCTVLDETCAVIEAMCAESYRSVVEVFYEAALKTKYSRDSYSGQCIDIIRDATKKNLIYEYHGQFGSGNIISRCIADGNTNIASAAASQIPASNKKIQAKIAELQK